MNQLVSLVDLSITGNGKTKGLPILIQELNTSQKDYVTLPGNYARGLYMTVSRAIDVQVDMDKDQTSEQEIKFLRDWIEKQMRTHLLFSDLGPDSLINSFIHSFILAWLFKTLLLRRAHIAL